MHNYLLWYKVDEESPEVVSCVTRNYYVAEEKADKLLWALKMIKSIKSVHEIGITRLECNKVELELPQVSSRWVIYKNNTWHLEE